MALPILQNWKSYFTNPDEGLGSSYERIMLNRLLLSIVKKFDIQTVLEVPVFGFTGITGLNSVELIRKGCKVVLAEHDSERSAMIKKVHEKMNLECDVVTVQSYESLPFADHSFDMTWNFSALWFVSDINEFLEELLRVTGTVMLLCVPNQSGIGYKWQESHSDIPGCISFHPEFINPKTIIDIMINHGWKLVQSDYFDCPPWPDIGMSKEKFFGKLLGKTSNDELTTSLKAPVSIVKYYCGTDDDFPTRMLKYSLLENYAPKLFKKFWSHHRWMLFIRN
jgi:SAM-dependent methyltransferase